MKRLKDWALNSVVVFFSIMLGGTLAIVVVLAFVMALECLTGIDVLKHIHGWFR